MNMHVTAYEEEREMARQRRLHDIEREAHEVHRQALLSIRAPLPEFTEASMHAAFLKLAGHLGYSVQFPIKKDAA